MTGENERNTLNIYFVVGLWCWRLANGLAIGIQEKRGMKEASGVGSNGQHINSVVVLISIWFLIVVSLAIFEN